MFVAYFSMPLISIWHEYQVGYSLHSTQVSLDLVFILGWEPSGGRVWPNGTIIPVCGWTGEKLMVVIT